MASKEGRRRRPRARWGWVGLAWLGLTGSVWGQLETTLTLEQEASPAGRTRVGGLELELERGLELEDLSLEALVRFAEERHLPRLEDGRSERLARLTGSWDAAAAELEGRFEAFELAFPWDPVRSRRERLVRGRLAAAGTVAALELEASLFERTFPAAPLRDERRLGLDAQLDLPAATFSFSLDRRRQDSRTLELALETEGITPWGPGALALELEEKRFPDAPEKDRRRFAWEAGLRLGELTLSLERTRLRFPRDPVKDETDAAFSVAGRAPLGLRWSWERAVRRFVRDPRREQRDLGEALSWRGSGLELALERHRRRFPQNAERDFEQLQGTLSWTPATDVEIEGEGLRKRFPRDPLKDETRRGLTVTVRRRPSADLTWTLRLAWEVRRFPQNPVRDRATTSWELTIRLAF